MGAEQILLKRTGNVGSEFRLPLLLGSLGAGMTAMAFASPIFMAVFCGVLILSFSILRYDPFLYLMVVLLPINPLFNFSNLPVHDIFTMVRILMLPGVLAGRWMSHQPIRSWLFGKNVDRWGTMYFLVAIISATVANPLTSSATSTLLKFASYLAFYFSLTGWGLSENKLWSLTKILFAACIVVSILGFSQILNGGYGDWHKWYYAGQEEYVDAWEGRATSVFEHVNQLAAYLNLVLPLALAIVCSRVKSAGLRRMATACFLLGTFAMVLTQSRGGFMGFFCLVGVVIYSFRETRHLIRKMVPAILAVALIAGVVSYLSSERAASVGGGGSRSLSTERFVELDSQTLIRLLLYQGAVNMFAAQPVFGIGYGNFRYAISAISDNFEYGALDTHNWYLKVLSETGTLGFLCFVGWIAAVFREGKNGLRKGTSEAERVFAAALLAALAAALVHGMVDVMIDLPQFGVLLWMLIALPIVPRHRQSSDALSPQGQRI